MLNIIYFDIKFCILKSDLPHPYPLHLYPSRYNQPQGYDHVSQKITDEEKEITKKKRKLDKKIILSKCTKKNKENQLMLIKIY